MIRLKVYADNPEAHINPYIDTSKLKVSTPELLHLSLSEVSQGAITPNLLSAPWTFSSDYSSPEGYDKRTINPLEMHMAFEQTMLHDKSGYFTDFEYDDTKEKSWLPFGMARLECSPLMSYSDSITSDINRTKPLGKCTERGKRNNKRKCSKAFDFHSSGEDCLNEKNTLRKISKV